MKINVKKGEKGIKVLVPIPYKKENDEGEVEQGVWFKVGHVFDISQTDGELPRLFKELQGNSEELRRLVDRLVAESNDWIRFAELGTANGCYSEKGIKLKPGMSSIQTFKTLVHEKAHSIMHGEGGVARETAELQAESVAFIVYSVMSVDTSEYSFGYVVGWARDKSLTELKKSLAVIEKTSREILDWVKETKQVA